MVGFFHVPAHESPFVTRTSRTTGQSGERLAESLLRRKGFLIREVNWRAGRYGEIDLIAFHPAQDLLVFIEVKTRRGAHFGSPLEAVDFRKQAQLRTLAEAYLQDNPQHPRTCCRFDAIGILDPGNGDPVEVTHIENAFGE